MWFATCSRIRSERVPVRPEVAHATYVGRCARHELHDRKPPWLNFPRIDLLPYLANFESYGQVTTVPIQPAIEALRSKTPFDAARHDFTFLRIEIRRRHTFPDRCPPTDDWPMCRRSGRVGLAVGEARAVGTIGLFGHVVDDLTGSRMRAS